ncbi:hypothetical protein OAJ75_02045 [Candidatus Pelagibacter sp.]|nr:hypothetical protein [Candidatus Pelagibacter sp.]
MKVIFDKIRRKIVYFVASIYANLINFWLLIIKKFTNYELIYPQYISFGDTFIFYLYKYSEIIKDKNKKIVIFGTTDAKNVKFLFKKNKYILNFFYIPSFFPEHAIQIKLRKLSYFQPTICNYLSLRNRDSIKNLIKINYKKKKIISKKILEYKNKNYILIFIKFYNDNINDLSGSCDRQTSNLKKIYDLIDFLLSKNLEVIIMGNNSDKSISLIRKFNFGNSNKKINFFKDMSDKYSIFDQLFAANNSIGYIGNGSAFAELIYFQRKKAVIFDCPSDSYTDQIHLEYRKILFKNIKIEEKIQPLDINFINQFNQGEIKSKFEVIETPLAKIIKETTETFSL